MDEPAFDVSTMLHPAVYLLLWRGVVVYVGQSRKPLARLGAHKTAWDNRVRGRRMPEWLEKKAIKFDAVKLVPTSADNLRLLEKKLILEFAPKHNVRGKPIITAPLVIQLRGVSLTLNDPAPPLPPPYRPHIYADMARRI